MNKIKLTIELSNKSAEIINSLRQKTDAKDTSDVLRKALSLFNAVVQAKENGFELYLKDDNGFEPISLLEEVEMQ